MRLPYAPASDSRSVPRLGSAEQSRRALAEGTAPKDEIIARLNEEKQTKDRPGRRAHEALRAALLAQNTTQARN